MTLYLSYRKQNKQHKHHWNEKSVSLVGMQHGLPKALFSRVNVAGVTAQDRPGLVSAMSHTRMNFPSPSS